VSIDKDQFDALIKLAEFKRAVREGRRQIEWKFTATAYVALAGLSVLNIPWCVVAIAVVLIWALHTLWVYWNMSSNERDRTEMYHYKDSAEKFLPAEIRYSDPKRVSGPRALFQQPACRFQIITSYGLGCFAIAVRYFGWLAP
jgi:hypothetical protein